MLTVSVLLYVLLSVIIGIYASKRVKNANDYMLAGKSLPMSLATTALFATWFGSETIMGAGATFAESGLRGVIEDPFGAFLALFLVGVVFAKHIYRLNIITLSDLFKNKPWFNLWICKHDCNLSHRKKLTLRRFSLQSIYG